jgi:hypothetical protein
MPQRVQARSYMKLRFHRGEVVLIQTLDRTSNDRVKSKTEVAALARDFCFAPE